MPRILFVSGFDRHTRARDLAYEFERWVAPFPPGRRCLSNDYLVFRYGPLVRCDVPAPRNYASASP
ncbi:hypothetical protein K439DRAFT_1634475 [Ramaria rubella]|nr:hypothetical protein K439DRAFT_1634475 [Ramaria rubella]